MIPGDHAAAFVNPSDHTFCMIMTERTSGMGRFGDGKAGN
jgi:hypothetical protein